jgi:hypothetical protein
MIRHPRKREMSFDCKSVYLWIASVHHGQSFLESNISRIHELFVVGPCRGIQTTIQGNGSFLVIRLQDREHLSDDVNHAVRVVPINLLYEKYARKSR